MTRVGVRVSVRALGSSSASSEVGEAHRGSDSCDRSVPCAARTGVLIRVAPDGTAQDRALTRATNHRGATGHGTTGGTSSRNHKPGAGRANRNAMAHGQWAMGPRSAAARPVIYI